MNIFKIFFSCIGIFLCFNLPVQAQTTPQGMLNDVLTEIQDCRTNIEQLQERMDDIAATASLSLTDPEKSLALWEELDAKLKANKKCLKKAEDDLNWLRKWYPSLFNKPSVTAPEEGKKPEREKPDPALKRLAENAQDAFDSANALLQQLFKQLESLKNK